MGILISTIGLGLRAGLGGVRRPDENKFVNFVTSAAAVAAAARAKDEVVSQLEAEMRVVAQDLAVEKIPSKEY